MDDRIGHEACVFVELMSKSRQAAWVDGMQAQRTRSRLARCFEREGQRRRALREHRSLDGVLREDGIHGLALPRPPGLHRDAAGCPQVGQRAGSLRFVLGHAFGRCARLNRRERLPQHLHLLLAHAILLPRRRGQHGGLRVPLQIGLANPCRGAEESARAGPSRSGCLLSLSQRRRLQSRPPGPRDKHEC